MNSTILLILFLAFYMLYNTSKKAIKSPCFGFEKWVEKNVIYSKLISASLLIMSCVLSCLSYGLGAGIFIFFIDLMTIGSLSVILIPIKVLKIKPIIIVFILSLCTELLLFNSY